MEDGGVGSALQTQNAELETPACAESSARHAKLVRTHARMSKSSHLPPPLLSETSAGTGSLTRSKLNGLDSIVNTAFVLCRQAHSNFGAPEQKHRCARFCKIRAARQRRPYRGVRCFTSFPPAGLQPARGLESVLVPDFHLVSQSRPERRAVSSWRRSLGNSAFQVMRVPGWSGCSRLRISACKA